VTVRNGIFTILIQFNFVEKVTRAIIFQVFYQHDFNLNLS